MSPLKRFYSRSPISVLCFSFSSIVFSHDGDQWYEETDSATLEWLGSVAWGNGRFVAVGWSGTIVHSQDGDHWEEARDGAWRGRTLLQDVTWDGARFVAIGLAGTTLYSDDGNHWVRSTERAALDILSAISWGVGRFVAVGSNGTIIATTSRWRTSTNIARSILCCGSGTVRSTDVHVAAQANDNPAVIMSLLNGGADPIARSDYDKTPWENASDNEALKRTTAYGCVNDLRWRAMESDDQPTALPSWCRS